MIGIKYQGTFLYIPKSTKIRMELFSPLFYPTQAGYSYAINLPIEQNSPILGYFDDMKYRGKITKSFEVDIYLFDNFWKKAILKIKSITNKDYIVNLSVDIGVVSDITKGKYLNEVNYGGDLLTRSTPTFYFKAKLQGFGVSGNVSFGAYNSSKPDLIADVTVPFNVSINQTVLDIVAAMNLFDKEEYGFGNIEADGDTITVYSIDNNSGVIPGTIEAGSGRFFNMWDATEETRIHMNTVLANPEDYNYAFPVVKNPEFYANAIAEYSSFYNNYVNYYNNDEYKINKAINGIDPLGDQGIYAITPMPYFVYVLQRSIESFGYKPEGEFLSEEEVKKILLYNNYSIDKNYHTFLKTYNAYINLRNHVPAITLNEFLKSVQSAFFLCFFPDTERRTFTIRTRNEILDNPQYEDFTSISGPDFNEDNTTEAKGYKITPLDDDASEEKVKDLTGMSIKDPVETIGDLPASGNGINDIRLVQSVNSYYRAISSTQWEEYSQDLGPYIIGDGSEEVELKIAITAMERFIEASGFDRKWLVPYISQPGASEALGKVDFNLRLLYFHHLQSDGDGNTYPLASPLKYNYNESPIGDFSLIPSEIYEKFGKKWLSFLSEARVIKKDIILDENVLKNLDYALKKRIDNVTYFLAKVDFTAEQNGKIVAVGTYYRYG